MEIREYFIKPFRQLEMKQLNLQFMYGAAGIPLCFCFNGSLNQMFPPTNLSRNQYYRNTRVSTKQLQYLSRWLHSEKVFDGHKAIAQQAMIGCLISRAGKSPPALLSCLWLHPQFIKQESQHTIKLYSVLVGHRLEKSSFKIRVIIKIFYVLVTFASS